jgi:hypothetical protein
VCTEGVWTGQKITVDLFSSTDGGARFGPSRSVPVAAADVAAAVGTATVAVGGTSSNANSAEVTLEASFDGGVTWQLVYHHSGGGWLELGFTSAEQGVAIVAGNGDSANTMLASHDGGKAWAPVSFG